MDRWMDGWMDGLYVQPPTHMHNGRLSAGTRPSLGRSGGQQDSYPDFDLLDPISKEILKTNFYWWFGPSKASSLRDRTNRPRLRLGNGWWEGKRYKVHEALLNVRNLEVLSMAGSNIELPGGESGVLGCDKIRCTTQPPGAGQVRDRRSERGLVGLAGAR